MDCFTMRATVENCPSECWYDDDRCTLGKWLWVDVTWWTNRKCFLAISATDFVFFTGHLIAPHCYSVFGLVFGFVFGFVFVFLLVAFY